MARLAPIVLVTLFATSASVYLSEQECDLCQERRKWLFILSTEDSNSTSTLKMLNGIDGISLASEIGDLSLLKHLYDSAKGKKGEWMQETTGAWGHLPISERSILCPLQKYARGSIGRLRSTTAITGFSELVQDVPAGGIPFLEQLFPCAKLIIQTRRSMAPLVDKSAYRKNTTEVFEASFLHNWRFTSTSEKMQYLEQLHKRYQEIYGESKSFMMFADDFSVERFNELLEWLGISMCKFTDIIGESKDETSADVKVDGTCSISWQ